MLVNKTTPFMMQVISDVHCAFIGNISIQDNLFIAQMKFYYLKRKKKGKAGYFALKTDMAKAYDRI